MKATSKDSRLFYPTALRALLAALLLATNLLTAKAAPNTSAQARTPATAAQLWREMQPLVAAGDAEAAHSLAARNAAAARALYRELLFDAFMSKLYGNPPLPHAEAARLILAAFDADGGALEAKLAEWSKETKPGVGFGAGGVGPEQILYLAHVAKLRGEDREADKVAPAGTAAELNGRALALSEAEGLELGVAAFSGNLAVAALRERRLDAVRAPVERAEKIWKEWGHPVGLFQAPLVFAYADYFGGRWKEAAENFARAAELGKALEGLRAERVNALSMLAAALRNLSDKEGVRAALAAAVEDQEKVLAGAGEGEARLNQSKTLADLQMQLAGALSTLGRHVEATEWFVRASDRNMKNYREEAASVEQQVAQYSAVFKQRAAESKDEAFRKSILSTLETYATTMLSHLESLAQKNNDMAGAAKYAERRLALARENGDPARIAEGFDAVANAHRKAGNYSKAREFAEEGLRIRSALPRRTKIYDSLYLLAQIAEDAEDWKAALARYGEVVEATKPGALPPLIDVEAQLAALPPAASDEATKASIRRSVEVTNSIERLSRASNRLQAKDRIGYLLTKSGKYREASQTFEEIEREIPLLYAVGAPDEKELSRRIAESGNPDFSAVEVAEQRRLYGFAPDDGEQKRMEIAGLSVLMQRATLLQYRAMLLEDINDLDGAAKLYERGSAAAFNLAGGSLPFSAAQVPLARIERERGNYEAASRAVEAALSEAVRRNDPYMIANMLSFQSSLRRDQGRLEESRRLGQDALKVARGLGSRLLAGAVLRTLGRTESALGGEHLKPAEQHLREALAVWRELNLRANVAYTLDSLGQALEQSGRDDEALASYTEAVQIVETLVAQLPKDSSIETFNTSRGNKDLYDHLIKLLIRKGRAAEALQYLERAKSKALVDALAGSNVNSKDPALNDLLERVRRSGDSVRVAEKELTEELSKPADERDAARVTDLRARVAEARKSYLESVEKIKRANPSYASLVAVNPTSLVEIQNRLPEKTLLLSYFPTDSELYVFVVTREGAPAVRTSRVGREELARLVSDYRAAILPRGVPSRGLGLAAAVEAGETPERDPARANELTGKLYEALLAPARDEIERAETILLVPAGELYYLPIHALGPRRPDGSVAYLIEQKRFAYFAAADLLNVVAGQSKGAAGEASRGTLLALGNPDGSLPGATQEVSALGKLFPKAEVFTGADATVSRVARTAAASVPYVHFATHGVINTRDPKESYLLLAGAPGRLSVKDIVEDTYRLSFEGTRLVTLSACDTNIGGWDPSATYSSLSRAFSKAGAPTVIASLWSVSDASTRDTMTVFYRELTAGTSKSEALRRAQLAVMRDPRFAQPFYWAPFIILGEWQ